MNSFNGLNKYRITKVTCFHKVHYVCIHNVNYVKKWFGLSNGPYVKCPVILYEYNFVQRQFVYEEICNFAKWKQIKTIQEWHTSTCVFCLNLLMLCSGSSHVSHYNRDKRYSIFFWSHRNEILNWPFLLEVKTLL